MGRGSIDFNDIVRVGLNTLTVKLNAVEKLEALFAKHLDERGVIRGLDTDVGVSDGMIDAYLDGTFPHERAARVIGEQLGLDWATLTVAHFLPSYPQRFSAGTFFPRDPGLEFQYGLALRTIGARSSSHAERTSYLSDWMRLGLHGEAPEEQLDWIVEKELERVRAGAALPIGDDYFSAADKMRRALRDGAFAEEIDMKGDLTKKLLAEHFRIAGRQAELIFFGQGRELRHPNWEAVEKVSEFLRMPTARVWLALASEALPYSQRQRRKGTMALHGQLAEDFERALALLPNEIPHDDNSKTANASAAVASHVADHLQVRFERSDWEQPYQSFVKEASA